MCYHTERLNRGADALSHPSKIWINHLGAVHTFRLRKLSPIVCALQHLRYN